MSKLLTKALEITPLSNLAYNLLGHYVTILMLHRPESLDGTFNGHSPALVERCLKYVKKQNFHIATPDEIISAALNNRQPSRPTICFTIDDGYADEANQLAPVFLKFGIQPTLFVITDFVDGIDWPWDAKISYLIANAPPSNSIIKISGLDVQLNLSDHESRQIKRRSIVKLAKTMQSEELAKLITQLSLHLNLEIPKLAPPAYQPATWTELRAHEQNGLILGSHGCSHKLFNALSDQEVTFELSRAKERLKEEIVSPSNVFCYPSGTSKDFSPRHHSLVKNAGYAAALSANPGNTNFSQIRQSPFNIMRHSFPNDFETFVRYTSWLEALRTRLA
jgi:peptidoglycan/xylan/chitin deacetylase (PgdA/CDA1 family)